MKVAALLELLNMDQKTLSRVDPVQSIRQFTRRQMSRSIVRILESQLATMDDELLDTG